MYWVDYLRRTHILVYVVDSSDRGRLPQAKDELHRLLKVDIDLPVVVLGNKQVTKGSMLGLNFNPVCNVRKASDWIPSFFFFFESKGLFTVKLLINKGHLIW